MGPAAPCAIAAAPRHRLSSARAKPLAPAVLLAGAERRPELIDEASQEWAPRKPVSTKARLSTAVEVPGQVAAAQERARDSRSTMHRSQDTDARICGVVRALAMNEAETGLDPGPFITSRDPDRQRNRLVCRQLCAKHACSARCCSVFIP